MSDTKKFTLDFVDTTWEAVSYGPTWNGWVTPVVTRDTLQDLFDCATGGALEGDPVLSVVWHTNGTAMITEPFGEETMYYEIAPDADGHYDLAAMGWTFDYADDDDNDND